MPHPAEARILAPSDRDVYEAVREAFPEKTDEQLVAALMRMIVFVAVCWNDVVEDGQSAEEVLARQVFFDCDDLAGHFPWPEG